MALPSVPSLQLQRISALDRRESRRRLHSGPTAPSESTVVHSSKQKPHSAPMKTSKGLQDKIKRVDTRRVRSLEPPRERESWQIQKAALKQKYGDEAWMPRKRLSPDALDGIRALHASDPERYPTEVLASQFEVTPDAIRRILKSKWRPNQDETEDRKKRWDRRGESIWTRLTELGMKPPKKWREMGIGQTKRDGAEKAKGNGVENTERRRAAIPWESANEKDASTSSEEGFGIPGHRIRDLV